MFSSFLKTLFLSACIVLLATFCEKKIFKKIKATGRILHFYTKQPISTGLSLVSDNQFSGSAKTVDIASGHSDENGYFTLKGKASKANPYYLYISEDRGQARQITLRENSTTDLGTFYTGSHTFHYKVRLIPDSGKCFKAYAPAQTLYFPAGTYTTLVFSNKVTWEDILSDLKFHYYTIDCGAGATQQMPHIASQSSAVNDTLNYIIHY